MGEKKETTVVVRKVFEADRDTLFRAFSNPEIMRRWFFVGEEGWSADVTSDFRVGGRYPNRHAPTRRKHLFASG